MKGFKRIFIITQMDESQKYGVGKYVEELCKEAEVRKEAYELIVVHVGCDKIIHTKISKLNSRVKRIKIPKSISNRGLLLTINYCKGVFCILQEKFNFRSDDIIHFNSNKQYNLIKEAKERTQSKLIYTMHVSLWRVFYNNNMHKFKESLQNKNIEYNYHMKSILAEIENCKLVDYIICLTQEMKEDIERYYYMNEDRVKVIPNGLGNTDGGSRDSDTHHRLKNRLNIKSDDFTVLYIGRLNKQKGVLVLLDVFINILNEGYDNMKLIFIGNGGYKTEMEEKASSYKNILFTGYLLPDQIDNYYNIGNALVLPSLNEQSSYVILEAMRAKIPIICSNIRAFNLLKDEFSSLKIELLDSGELDPQSLIENIMRLYIDPNIGSQLSRNANKLFHEKFSISRVFNETYLH